MGLGDPRLHTAAVRAVVEPIFAARRDKTVQLPRRGPGFADCCYEIDELRATCSDLIAYLARYLTATSSRLDRNPEILFFRPPTPDSLCITASLATRGTLDSACLWSQLSGDARICRTRDFGRVIVAATL